ncbi:MAG: CHASE3 domain-containing protein [Hydrogenophaga sp.]|jgi:signal transduction histidine kinase|uniref:CHASE3 domain-containing protein n=1 Tax=Hydrogenophaga sp. TaxID=1904254 RepID=UPI001D693F0A|nr:CHASE3 domain-containing protein [Hydrogenophaga sp.]MBW0171598.1 CHASE3 domain-containing protein [Hydrogenophaga sp.]MBW0184192.1 CHASE3 domain-containing protein [Hydrogenophaga sp.]
MPSTLPRPAAPWRTPLAIFLAAVLALGVVMGSEWTYQRALQSLASVGARDNARTAIQTVMRRLLDVETAQRGYLLTGRAQYLAPYQAAESDMAHAISRLREHYRDDKELLALVDNLEIRVLEKSSEVAETIALYNAGSGNAWRELMLTDIGREKMEGVRRVADVLLVTEERRVAGERAEVYRTLAIGRVGVHSLALLSLLAYVFFLRKNAALQTSQVEHARHLQAERDSLERQVRERTEELAHLNLNLQELRDGERSRLARALHDDLGALLTTAKLDLTRLRHALRNTEPEVAERLQHLSVALDDGIGTKRRMMEELMPSTLHNLGLQAAIEQRADEFQQRTGVPVERAIQSMQLDVSSGQALFAVVQGALANIEQHAGARHVSLRLASEGTQVLVEVIDDGRGFDGHMGSTSASGLKNLRHRIESLGGQFLVRSVPGSGTRIEARVPGLPRPSPSTPHSAMSNP